MTKTDRGTETEHTITRRR